jgi:hypothetical protein
MHPEVMAAINYASTTFVPLNDLHDAVGKRIAVAGRLRGGDGDLPAQPPP